MSGDDESPRDVLGDAVWQALGEVEPAELPEGLDAGFRARLAEEQGREALGDPLWNALGAAAEVPAPSWQRAANRPGRWRTAVAVAAAIAAVFLAVPQVRRATTPAPRPAAGLELALVRDLELAEHLDLLAHPDFDVLVAWDGEVP